MKRVSLVGGVAVAIAVLSTSGCGQDAKPPTPVKPTASGPASKVHVQLSGCSARIGDGLCELHSDQVSLTALVTHAAASTKAPPSTFSLQDQELRPAEIVSISPAITRYRLPPVPLSAGEHLLVVTTGPNRYASFRLKRIELPEPLARAIALKDARKNTEALDTLGTPDALPKPWRSVGRSLRGRLLLRTGKPQAALSALTKARAEHVAAQRWSDALSDGFVEAFMRISSTGELARARQLLDGLTSMQDRWPHALASLHFYRGLLQKAVGDWRGAGRHLQRAEELATSIGDTQVAKFAAITHRRMRGLMGDRAAYDAYLAQELTATDRAADPCLYERLLAYRAENAYLHAEERGSAEPRPPWMPDPVPLLTEALNLANGACGEPQRELSNRVDLALVALQGSDFKTARSQLQAARAMTIEPESYIQVWLSDIEARVLISEGALDKANALYAGLKLRGEAMGAPEVQWRASLGLGRTAQARGDGAAAERHYRHAESMLSEELAGIPSGRAAAAFVAARRQSSRRLASLLVKTGRHAAAFDVLRRSATRALLLSQRADRLSSLTPERKARWDALMVRYRTARQKLDTLAADDWKLTTEQLRESQDARRVLQRELVLVMSDARGAMGAPAPLKKLSQPESSERLLGIFPWTAAHWWVFERTASGLNHRVLRAGAGELQRYLGTLDWKGVSKLRVVGATEGLSADLHATVVDTRRLVDMVSVVYGLDLPAPESRGPLERLLIVADPVGDLPQARAEGRSLAKRSPLPHKLLVGEDATFSQLSASLGRAQLLHFAGHGSYAGQESALTLAGEAPLRLGDILALPQPPLKVVLTGCETARTAPSDTAVTLGTGHAFAVSGAQEVVASARPVGDAQAAAFAQELYAQLPRHDWKLAEAVAATQASLWRRQPTKDWGTFRVIVP